MLKPHFLFLFAKIVTWEMASYTPIHDFAGWSRTPGLVEGVYKDPDTGRPVSDKSRRYVVALPHRELDRLRRYLREVGAVFKQKIIYLSVAGQVEFVEACYEAISDTEAGDL